MDLFITMEMSKEEMMSRYNHFMTLYRKAQRDFENELTQRRIDREIAEDRDICGKDTCG